MIKKRLCYHESQQVDNFPVDLGEERKRDEVGVVERKRGKSKSASMCVCVFCGFGVESGDGKISRARDGSDEASARWGR